MGERNVNPGRPCHIPLVFLACLILLKRSEVVVYARERDLKALAFADGVGDRLAADPEHAVFHAWQFPQRLKLSDKLVLVLVRDVGLELEENYFERHKHVSNVDRYEL